jgi:hypothetical protein
MITPDMTNDEINAWILSKLPLKNVNKEKFVKLCLKYEEDSKKKDSNDDTCADVKTSVEYTKEEEEKDDDSGYEPDDEISGVDYDPEDEEEDELEEESDDEE